MNSSLTTHIFRNKIMKKKEAKRQHTMNERDDIQAHLIGI